MTPRACGPFYHRAELTEKMERAVATLAVIERRIGGQRLSVQRPGALRVLGGGARENAVCLVLVDVHAPRELVYFRAACYSQFDSISHFCRWVRPDGASSRSLRENIPRGEPGQVCLRLLRAVGDTMTVFDGLLSPVRLAAVTETS